MTAAVPRRVPDSLHTRTTAELSLASFTPLEMSATSTTPLSATLDLPETSERDAYLIVLLDDNPLPPRVKTLPSRLTTCSRC